MITNHRQEIGGITEVGKNWYKVSCVVHADQLPQVLEARQQVIDCMGREHRNPTVTNGIALSALSIEYTVGASVPREYLREFVKLVFRNYDLLDDQFQEPEL